MSCRCGIPNRANWFVRAIIGRPVPGGTETDYVDVYVCDGHMPASELSKNQVGSLFAFSGASEWDILEWTVRDLGRYSHNRHDHVDYPHPPGYLFDCPGCEQGCHCSRGSAECVFSGVHQAFND